MTRILVPLLTVLLTANAWLQVTHPLPQRQVKATCSSDQMIFYANYFEQFDLSPGVSFAGFQAKVTNFILSIGRNTQMAVCNWFRKLEKDLKGIDTQEVCMNIDSLSQVLSVSTTDGDNFMTDYFREQFECGEGYDILINNFDCLSAVYMFHRDALDVCVDALNAATNGSISDMAACLAYNDYVSCDNAIYTQYCGSQVSQFVCRVNEITMKVNTDHCDSVLQTC